MHRGKIRRYSIEGMGDSLWDRHMGEGPHLESEKDFLRNTSQEIIPIFFFVQSIPLFNFTLIF